jgi:hypothetical protein
MQMAVNCQALRDTNRKDTFLLLFIFLGQGKSFRNTLYESNGGTVKHTGRLFTGLGEHFALLYVNV